MKLELEFNDRVGIIADVSALIAGRGLNIGAMEVVRTGETAHIFIQIEGDGGLSERKEMVRLLKKIRELINIRFVENLPHEEREKRFRVVLDNISDGVLSIDREGRVTTLNSVARKALELEGRDVLGTDMRKLALPDYSLLDCLEGKYLPRTRQNLISKGGRYQYIAIRRSIRDSRGRIIGAVEIAKDMHEIRRLASAISEPKEIGFTDIVGRSPVIREAVAFAEKIASTDSIITIRGDSGTGKELFARAIHAASGRKGPFVPLNCAAIPEQLLESELFGYEGGAFTGGRREGKPGLFEIAGEGTVFLDEIGEMPPGAQAKILRVIQERGVRRIGGSTELPVSARIITATNRNLEDEVRKKRFRQDLYFRISVLPILIPPLKERIEDIPILIEHYLFQLSSRLRRNPKSFTREALEKMKRHDWPGNIRELRNVVERAAIFSEDDKIGADAVIFSHEIAKGVSSSGPAETGAALSDLPLKKQIARYEQKIIAEALRRHPSIRKAAAALGLSHTALRNKIKKLKIRMERKISIGSKIDIH